MRWSDYIKIRGYDAPPPDAVDPGIFECFQGVSGNGNGNEAIDFSEIEYQLSQIRNATSQVSTYVYYCALNLTAVKESIWQVRDMLKNGLMYDNGTKAILDTALLYLDDFGKQSFFDRRFTNADGLQEWMAAIEQWLGDVEAWLEAVEAYSAFMSDGGTGDPPPVPVQPQLPDLSGFISLPALIAKFGPWGIVMWVGMKIGIRLIEYWLKKKIEGGDQSIKAIRDIMQKAFLYVDTDNKKKSILEKALIYQDDENLWQAYLDDIMQLLENAEATEGVLELGKNAIWLKSKVAHH